MNWEIPIASRLENSGREILFISGSNWNGKMLGTSAAFFSFSIAFMVGNGASTVV